MVACHDGLHLDNVNLKTRIFTTCGDSVYGVSFLHKNEAVSSPCVVDLSATLELSGFGCHLGLRL